MKIVDLIGASLPPEFRGEAPSQQERPVQLELPFEKPDWSAWDVRVGVVIRDENPDTLALSYDGMDCHVALVRDKESPPSGTRVVIIPEDSHLPDEPEFSSLGASRVCTSCALYLTLQDAAHILARRLPGNPASWECDDALELAEKTAQAVLQCFPIGSSIAVPLGILPAGLAEAYAEETEQPTTEEDA